MAVPMIVKIPEPITAPIPSDVKLSQPNDFLSCFSGFSESEINRSIFLVRKSCAPNHHLPVESQKNLHAAGLLRNIIPASTHAQHIHEIVFVSGAKRASV